MRGLVSCIKHHADSGRDDYFLVAREGGGLVTRAFKSSVLISVGEYAEFSIKENTIESASDFEDKSEIGGFERLIEEKAMGMARLDFHKIGISEADRITSRMWKELAGAARLLMRKLILAAPIMVRFHNDVDGTSGAYCLHKAIESIADRVCADGCSPNIHWRMHSGVIYAREDAENDALLTNTYECVEKPLLVVLDFGTAKESNKGIDIAKEKFDIIWLDHHPMVDGFGGRELEHYINPWLFGGDSNYTAGFLTCEFTKTFASIESKDIENASLIGDYSTYVRPNERSRRLAVLLDLITSDTRIATGSRSSNLNPEEIDTLLKDKTKSDELIAYAENRVLEMLDSAIESVKVYKGKEVSIYVAAFENIRGSDEQRYPLPGRFTSRLLNKIEELNGMPCVLLLHFGSYISIRMSKKLIEKMNLLRMLDEVREEYSDSVDSSGGHSNAASIKLKCEERKKEIIKAVVDRLKEMV